MTCCGRRACCGSLLARPRHHRPLAAAQRRGRQHRPVAVREGRGGRRRVRPATCRRRPGRARRRAGTPVTPRRAAHGKQRHAHARHRAPAGQSGRPWLRAIHARHHVPWTLPAPPRLRPYDVACPSSRTGSRTIGRRGSHGGSGRRRELTCGHGRRTVGIPGRPAGVRAAADAATRRGPGLG